MKKVLTEYAPILYTYLKDTQSNPSDLSNI